MSHRLQLLIPESLHARVRKASQRRRSSVGAWVRAAIERALSEDERGGDPLERLASLGGPTADIDEMIGQIDRGRA